MDCVDSRATSGLFRGGGIVYTILYRVNMRVIRRKGSRFRQATQQWRVHIKTIQFEAMPKILPGNPVCHEKTGPLGTRPYTIIFIT